jgi:hypothetical protein
MGTPVLTVSGKGSERVSVVGWSASIPANAGTFFTRCAATGAASAGAKVYSKLITPT